MYSLRVNAKTKELVEEVADMVGLTVSSIMRKVCAKMENGKIRRAPEDETIFLLKQRDGNVINIKVPKTYHMDLSEWITAEMDPIDGHSINLFRSSLVAACLDTVAKNAARHAKKKELDTFYKNYESQFIAERRALYAEVM